MEAVAIDTVWVAVAGQLRVLIEAREVGDFAVRFLVVQHLTMNAAFLARHPFKI